MSNVVYKKLDKRHAGNVEWKYYIIHKLTAHGRAGMYEYETKQVFMTWRNWCWASWGPSKELSEWMSDDTDSNLIAAVAHNDKWCWQNDNTPARIYLRDDAVLSMFLLRWA